MSSLITLVPNLLFKLCRGGIKIGIGVDDNGDMQLQNSEIDSTCMSVMEKMEGRIYPMGNRNPTDIADGDDDTTYDGSILQ